MPGLDRTGPTGMGPMTGGARGWCNPSGGHFDRGNYGSLPGGGRGRGRGHRHMYLATGIPGRLRFRQAGQWGPFPAPYTRDQETSFLKDQAAGLKDELEAIENRIRDLDSEDKVSE